MTKETSWYNEPRRRGHRDDPLYESLKLLTIGHERIDDKANTSSRSSPKPVTPHGEVRMARYLKETLRGHYDQPAEHAPATSTTSTAA